MAKQTGKKKPLIANMGLFWRKDAVFWRGNRGAGRHTLNGKQRRAKRSGPVDFWDQVGIYALYAEYKLVYVGQAGMGDKASIGSRLLCHTKDHLAGRWDMFSWFGFRKVNKTDQKLGVKTEWAPATLFHQLADVLEGVLIEVAEPPQNSQKGRFGPDVQIYLQQPYEEEADKKNIYKEEADQIKNINKLVKKIHKEVRSIGKARRRLN